MKHNLALKQFMKELITVAQQEGLDLSSDSIVYRMTYPEHPEILVEVKIGGLFFDESLEAIEENLQ